MKKYLFILTCMVFPLNASAQASGGQIVRNKKEQRVSSSAKVYNRQKPLAKSPSTNNAITEQSLKQIDWNKMRSSDIALVEDDINKSLNYLESLSTLECDPENLIYKNNVQRLLQNKHYDIDANELVKYKKVRSIQVCEVGIFKYDFFNCYFSKKNGTVYFQKTSGSQRKSGYLYRKDSHSLIFLGGWTVNDDPLTSYGGEKSVVGTLYKLSSQKIIMLFWEKTGFEIYEFSK